MNLRGKEQKPFADHSNGMIFIDIQCWWFFATPPKNDGVRQLG